MTAFPSGSRAVWRVGGALPLNGGDQTLTPPGDDVARIVSTKFMLSAPSGFAVGGNNGAQVPAGGGVLFQQAVVGNKVFDQWSDEITIRGVNGETLNWSYLEIVTEG